MNRWRNRGKKSDNVKQERRKLSKTYKIRHVGLPTVPCSYYSSFPFLLLFPLLPLPPTIRPHSPSSYYSSIPFLLLFLLLPLPPTTPPSPSFYYSYYSPFPFLILFLILPLPPLLLHPLPPIIPPPSPSSYYSSFPFLLLLLLPLPPTEGVTTTKWTNNRVTQQQSDTKIEWHNSRVRQK